MSTQDPRAFGDADPALSIATANLPALTAADLTVIEGEPRLRDWEVAVRLGFDQPRDIRKLIQRNQTELEAYGPSRHGGAMVDIGSGAKRRVEEYWLNEPQCLLICMFSRTARAAEVRRQVIAVYMAWRHGQAVPGPAKAPPVRMGKALYEALGQQLAATAGELRTLEARVEALQNELLATVPTPTKTAIGASTRPTAPKLLPAKADTDARAQAWAVRARACAEARFAVLMEIKRRAGRKTICTVINGIIEQARNRTLPAWLATAAATANARPRGGKGVTLSRATIMAWRRAYATGGIKALEPRPTALMLVPEQTRPHDANAPINPPKDSDGDC